MKNYKYHIARTVPQSNREMKKNNKKTQNITPSEQFQNTIEKSQKDAKSIPLIHKYMTAHFPDLVQIGTGTSKKVEGSNYCYGL